MFAVGDDADIIAKQDAAAFLFLELYSIKSLSSKNIQQIRYLPCLVLERLLFYCCFVEVYCKLEEYVIINQNKPAKY